MKITQSVELDFSEIMIGQSTGVLKNMLQEIEAELRLRANSNPEEGLISREMKMAHEGHKVRAVIAYRTRTGEESLMVAKNVVEEYLLNNSSRAELANDHAMKGMVEREKEFVRNNQKIEAIKAIRERTGCDLIVAQDVMLLGPRPTKEVLDKLAAERDRHRSGQSVREILEDHLGGQSESSFGE